MSVVDVMARYRLPLGIVVAEVAQRGDAGKTNVAAVGDRPGEAAVLLGPNKVARAWALTGEWAEARRTGDD